MYGGAGMSEAQMAAQNEYEELPTEVIYYIFYQKVANIWGWRAEIYQKSLLLNLFLVVWQLFFTFSFFQIFVEGNGRWMFRKDKKDKKEWGCCHCEKRNNCDHELSSLFTWFVMVIVHCNHIIKTNIMFIIVVIISFPWHHFSIINTFPIFPS